MSAKLVVKGEAIEMTAIRTKRRTDVRFTNVRQRGQIQAIVQNLLKSNQFRN